MKDILRVAPKTMGLPKILVVVMMVVWTTSYLEADAQEPRDSRSAVSYGFCSEFEPAETVNFDVSVQPNSPQGTTKPRLTVTLSGTTQKSFLSGTIDQRLGVKDVQVTSASMTEICFQSLVVDTTIIIDKETKFKASCESTTDTAGPPCNDFESDVAPVFVCPQAMTELLKKEGVITEKPALETSQNEGKPPVYDITEDMAQASFAIVGGIAEGTRLARNHRAVAKSKTLSRIFRSFNSFLKVLGPVLNSFGGMTSILTTFLTPNHFDEMVNYMKEQFDIVQRQLRDIGDDIKALELVVESLSQKIAMSTALRFIRHTTRSYKRMLRALEQYPVCDTTALLELVEVKSFMAESLYKDLRNNLEDLLDVEFGGVLEASTGLLKPLMRAYCVSRPGRVKRFMRHISLYARGGTLALFAYENLECLKNGGKNCANLDKDREDWMRKLYQFTAKAKLYQEAIDDPLKGLELDMKDEIKKIIHDEVKKVPNPSPTFQFPGLFDKVNSFIINKLNDPHDWPYTCIVHPKSDQVQIFGVAQTNDQDFGSLNLNRANLQIVRYQTKQPRSGYNKKIFYTPFSEVARVVSKNGNEPLYVECPSANKVCFFRPWALNGVPPNTESNDHIIYFMFNPMNFKKKTGTQQVIIKMLPMDVYFIPESQLTEAGLPNLVVGCYEAGSEWPRTYHCLSRPQTPVRYVTLIGE
ncbi:hypothetical protein OS493_007231 [Desmophyllum pertusum]|uniref:Uncharacterized protein n=1 Tax=Desmophyllum pertusum TaxID=174260 RepID=A0A9W9ZG24_9CNID|nr:hypothetical protein OS493_007231 [Desmophyllum pertusum]